MAVAPKGGSSFACVSQGAITEVSDIVHLGLKR